MDCGKEVKIPTVEGEYLCFESYEANTKGCSYVRFVNERGEEIAYWDHEEWSAEPQLVMGAIMACIQSGGGG